MGLLSGISHAVGGVTGGLFGGGGSGSAKDAARAQEEGLNKAIDQYNTGYQGQQDLWNPWQSFGMGAMGNLSALNSGNFSSLYSSPDYQFALQQGNQALGQNQAARGNLFSGGAGRELAGYNQGLASQQLGNYRNALFNQLNYGQNATNALSSALQNKTSGIANANIGIGDARASAYVNSANSRQAGMGNLLNFGGNVLGGYLGGGGGFGGMFG